MKQIALALAQECSDLLVPQKNLGQRCTTVIPPAPSDKDGIKELLSIELQLASIPNLSAVYIDDIVALAMANEADLNDAQKALQEMFQLDEMILGDSSNVTVIPQSRKKAVNE